MDLRTLPDGLSPEQRCTERLHRIEQELGVELSMTAVDARTLGEAEEKNCELMFGQIPLPVGYAGPLPIVFEDEKNTNVHLPLATTEGALVASMNRGCKTLRETRGVRTSSTYHGMTRSIAFCLEEGTEQAFIDAVEAAANKWKAEAQNTSAHLTVLSHSFDAQDDHVFLTLACDTDEAMGMNMVTIAAQSAADWIIKNVPDGSPILMTIAGNVDSDKKPSRRTHDVGRGYEVTAKAHVPASVLEEILHVTPEQMLAVAHAKLQIGSNIAGAIGHNLHAANIIAALYLATGQDAAHVVEGSLTDTTVEPEADGITISVRLPAVLVGVRGGGTTLPAQKQCLDLLLGRSQQTSKPTNQLTELHPCRQLAETIGAAVLAGELSLLAAQASHDLARSHQQLAR